ncbi:hypothetical protein [Streptomyces sp. NPDC086776]|uniref:hypothetical protein n=1 Tax=Streptomyces sp. NPDC086776 TaxID=3365756 RepID=UPI00380C45B9
MSQRPTQIHYEDMVTLGGRRGIVDRDWHYYPHDPNKRLILFADGGSQWAMTGELVKLREEFIGMPNEGNMPTFGNPIESWQQIPHEYDEYLTWSLNAGCMYCGLPERAEIHTTAPG